MKSTFTIIAILLCTLFVKAQITITRADFGNIYFHAIQANDLNVDTSIHVGNASATAQTWNFAALHDSLDDSLQFMSVAATPYSSSFGAANLAFTQNNNPGVVEFVNASASSLVINGQGFDSAYFSTHTPAEAVVVAPVDTLLNFPTTYNSAFNGSYNYIIKIDSSFHYTYIVTVPIDTVELKNTTTYHSVIDAWGSITTPNGTYNCLRQKLTEYSTDSILVYVDTAFLTFPAWYNTGATIKDSTLTYRWYASAQGFTLAEIDMTPDTTTHTWSPSQASWLKSSNTGINNITTINSAISIYPNPATSEINVLNTSNGAVMIAIYDMMGSKVNEQLLTDRITNISTSKYAAGIYSYRVLDSNNNAVSSGKFSIMK